VFNSQATERGLKLGFWQRKAVLWNGVAGPGQLPARAAHDRLHLLLIGRFNAWKGQLLLLQAIARLPGHLRDRVRVRLVGGVFGGQSHFADRLASMIAEEKLTEVAEIRPFAADPSPHYAWADAVVVPSTKPEPFGLVAIEAMAWGCSVIAANHGGLAEIVVDGVTGSLVRPGSADALASAIARYLENPGLAAEEGVRGRERFEARFEESHYKAGIVQIIAAVAGAELV
jgi:glycosyltransferase involved in cell wall biosynthesis